jgi:hypothetical protein
VPLTFTSDEAWRRFELSSTSVWSGDRPRSVAGRIVSVPSARPGRGKLNEGNAMDSAWLSSVTPTLARASADTMSTATAVSSADRSATRVPVTMMFSRSSLAACATPTCAAVAANSADTMRAST